MKLKKKPIPKASLYVKDAIIIILHSGLMPFVKELL